MKKKILTFFITLCMVLSLIPLTAFAEEEGTSRYVKVDQITVGGQYLIVNDATVGSSSSRALKNPGGSSDGTKISASNGKTTVEVLEGNYIETADTDIVWTASSNEDGFYLTNNDDYLEVYQGNLMVFNPVKNEKRYWNYSENHLGHYGGSNTYYVSYSSGSFSYSSSAKEIYLFEKVTEQTEDVDVTGVTLNKSTATVSAGQTISLTASVQPSNATNKRVTWTSSDTDIAAVDASGVVTGVAAGTATITVTTEDGNKTDECVVTVTEPVNPNATVNITPTTDNPEESVTIDVGDILAINITNGSSQDAYDFTLTLSKDSIAEIQGSSTVNVAKGGTGQIIVKGLTDGNVDISISNNNSHGDQYSRKGVIHLTVGEGGTEPVDPPTPGEGTKYKLVDTVTVGKNYLIVSANSAGTGYALKDNGGDSSGIDLDSTVVTVSADGNDTVVYTNTYNIVWTVSANASGTGFDLSQNGDYLQFRSGHYKISNPIYSANRYWTYENYTMSQLISGGSSSTASPYYLYWNGSEFTSSSSSHNIYLYEEVNEEHTHTYGGPVWSWPENFVTRAVPQVKATFTCVECDDEQVITATVTGPDEDGAYTASVTGPDGKEYTDKRVEKQEAAEDEYTITISADKTDVQPGDTVNFTITLGPVEHFGTMQMELVIPEGLTYVANSGKLADGLKETLGFDNVAFVESTKIINGTALSNDYQSDTDTVIATFSCTVDEGFTGEVEVGLDYLEFYSCETWEEYTSYYKINKAVIKLADSYTINYDLAGGALPDGRSNPASYTVNDAFTLVNPTRDGYTFAGWTGSNGTTPQTEVAIAAGTTGDLTYIANWTLVEYTITYNLDGGTNASTNPEKYTIETEAITLADPTKAGSTFDGWYSDANFSTKVTVIAKGSTGDVTLYAKWTVNTFSVSGVVTSFTVTADDGETYGDGEVTVNLLQGTVTVKTATLTGTNAEYTFAEVPVGTYTLEVSKADHATRTYEVIVSDKAVTQDAAIFLLGDIDGNGKVTAYDYAMTNWFVTGEKTPTDYQKACADVNADGTLTTFDTGYVNSHAKKQSIIWAALKTQP